MIWRKIAAAISPLFAVQATAIYHSMDGAFTPLVTSGGPADAATRLLHWSQLTLAQALYRIAQAALNNIIKHAGATQTHVNLSYTNAQVTLQVRDNGRGFDPLARLGHGFVLRTMGERASAIGATCTIMRRQDQGMQVRVCWNSAQSDRAYAPDRTDSRAVGLRNQALVAKAIGS